MGAIPSVGAESIWDRSDTSSMMLHDEFKHLKWLKPLPESCLYNLAILSLLPFFDQISDIKFTVWLLLEVKVDGFFGGRANH